MAKLSEEWVIIWMLFLCLYICMSV
jgi:hypothetical protein